jgi:hypothetical protein
MITPPPPRVEVAAADVKNGIAFEVNSNVFPRPEATPVAVKYHAMLHLSIDSSLNSNAVLSHQRTWQAAITAPGEEASL